MKRLGLLLPLFFMFILVLQAGSVFYQTSIQEKDTEPDTTGTRVDWLDGFPYRAIHTMSQQAGADANYQINLEIHPGGGSSSGNTLYLQNLSVNFPHDIRFTGDDGATLLPYWIQDETADPIDVWINLDGNLTDGDVDFYVYCGKEGLTSISDGYDVFPFFDDFEDGDISDWDTLEVDNNNDATPTTDARSSAAYHGNYGLYNKQTDGGGSYGATSYLTADNLGLKKGGHAFGFWAKYTDFSSASRIRPFVRVTNDGGTTTETAPYYLYWEYWSGSGSWINLNYVADTWKHSEVYLQDDTTMTYNEVIFIRLGVSSWNGYAEGFYDDFYLRNYTSPEPSHSTWGSFNENIAPIANAGGNYVFNLNDTVLLNGSLSTGDIDNWNWSVYYSNDTLAWNGTGENVSFNASEIGVGLFNVSLYVDNVGGGNDYSNVTLTINYPPVSSVFTLIDYATSGENVTLNGTLSIGYNLTYYNWSVKNYINQVVFWNLTNVTTWNTSGLIGGVYTVYLEVEDEYGSSDNQSETLVLFPSGYVEYIGDNDTTYVNTTTTSSTTNIINLTDSNATGAGVTFEDEETFRDWFTDLFPNLLTDDEDRGSFLDYLWVGLVAGGGIIAVILIRRGIMYWWSRR